MIPWIEIIMPIRNPGSPLAESVASLVAQSTRGFAVVLSDNWSSKGLENLEAAAGILESAGIPVRRVRPPFELGRVQHWNWAHLQGGAEWLKPLFVGDLLLPHCIERLEQRVRQRPDASIIRVQSDVSQAGMKILGQGLPFPDQYLSPKSFLQRFPTQGNWIGGPINVAYRRDSFLLAGGYPVQLPACADYALNSSLAVRHGLEVIHETLTVFQLHEQRFSHGIARRRVNGYFEYWFILREAAAFCEEHNLPWPAFGTLRALAREVRGHYWGEKKRRIKRWLGRE